MHWLFDILIDVILWFIPWDRHHDDRSIVGESRMDRQARWIAWGLLALIIFGVAAYILFFRE